MRRTNAVSLLVLALGLMPWSGTAERRADAQKSDLLVMVVSRSNAAVTEIKKSDARKLLLGESNTWPNGVKVVVVLTPAGSGDRAEVLKKVCGMGEAEFTRFNLQVMFAGGTVASVQVVNSAASVKKIVKSNPGAIGFLRESDVDASVKPVWRVE